MYSHYSGCHNGVAYIRIYIHTHIHVLTLLWTPPIVTMESHPSSIASAIKNCNFLTLFPLSPMPVCMYVDMHVCMYVSTIVCVYDEIK